jgi:hypothetical protein
MHVSMIGEKVLLLVFVVGLAMFLSSLTIALVKLHRAWNVIQPLRLSDRTELGMPSPGIAVGLLFVPILGAYWLFPAQAGLAIRMNKFIRARSFGVQPLSVPLAIALSCSQLLIPAAVLFAFFLMGTETFALSDVRLLTLVVMLPALANILLQYSFVVSINRATDDLLEALSARAA